MIAVAESLQQTFFKQSALKQFGIGSLLGLLFFVAGVLQSGNPAPAFGLALLFQVIGAAIGGIVLYVFARLVWVAITRV